MKIEYVLFDCWQTLFTQNVDEIPLVKFARILGRDINDPEYMKIFSQDFMTSQLSHPIKVMNHLRNLGMDRDVNLESELMNLLDRLTENIIAYKDSLPCLMDLRKKGYKLGLITNAIPASTRALQKRFRYQNYFHFCAHSYELGIVKPNPEIFRHTLSELGCDNWKKAVMIGDTIHDDFDTPALMGIQTLLLDRKAKHSEFEGYRIFNLVNLDGVLQELF